VIDLGLAAAKFGFLAFLYLFLFWAVRAVLKETRKPAGGPIDSAVVIDLDSDSTRTPFNLDGPTPIGRSPENGLVLDDTTVSTFHARLWPQGDHWFIEDLTSRNGTFVNGRRLDGRQKLNSGDEIKVGRRELKFMTGAGG
jgi:pSer/pThr/pTyr-binding forkhead associated (FHA) protein